VWEEVSKRQRDWDEADGEKQGLHSKWSKQYSGMCKIIGQNQRKP